MIQILHGDTIQARLAGYFPVGFGQELRDAQLIPPLADDPGDWVLRLLTTSSTEYLEVCEDGPAAEYLSHAEKLQLMLVYDTLEDAERVYDLLAAVDPLADEDSTFLISKAQHTVKLLVERTWEV